MKYLLILLLLLLSACAESPSGDPYALRAQADAAIQSTQRTALQEAKAATLEAAATKKSADTEIELLNARLDATARALSFAQTQSAGTQQARDDQATRMAIAVIGTQTAVSYSATQTVVHIAVVAAQDQAKRDQYKADFWAKVLPWSLAISSILLVAGLLYFLWILKDWVIEWMNRKHSVFNGINGMILYFPDGQPQLVSEMYHNRPRPMLHDGQAVQWIGKNTTVSPVIHKDPDGITVQARRLLQLAIEQEGPSTVKIPGWRQAGMTSDVWQRVIGALRYAGVVETEPGEGTFICYEHQTAAYALQEIQTGKVRVRPAPQANLG